MRRMYIGWMVAAAGLAAGCDAENGVREERATSAHAAPEPARAAGDDQRQGPPEQSANAIAAALPALPRTAEGVRIPLDQIEPMVWRPEGEGTDVFSENGTLRVRYERTRGAAFGVAILLKPGELGGCGALKIRMRATPALRPFVCLTDTDGGVWTFPTVRFDHEPGEATLWFADLRADPYQNQGRSLPARPEISKIRMLTVLDLSGHMGGAEGACVWTVESVEGVRP